MTAGNDVDQTTPGIPHVSPYAEALPLVIAVTGHRDLVASETAELRQKVRTFFLELIERFPFRQLRLLSSLALGRRPAGRGGCD